MKVNITLSSAENEGYAIFDDEIYEKLQLRDEKSQQQLDELYTL